MFLIVTIMVYATTVNFSVLCGTLCASRVRTLNGSCTCRFADLRSTADGAFGSSTVTLIRDFTCGSGITMRMVSEGNGIITAAANFTARISRVPRCRGVLRVGGTRSFGNEASSNRTVVSIAAPVCSRCNGFLNDCH